MRLTTTEYVHVTGPCAAIETLFDTGLAAAGRKCDLHGKMWIEMPKVEAEFIAAAQSIGCKVHFVQPK